jgi:hypothetical protein
LIKEFETKSFCFPWCPWCTAPLSFTLRAVLPRMIRIRIMNQGCPSWLNSLSFVTQKSTPQSLHINLNHIAKIDTT